MVDFKTDFLENYLKFGLGSMPKSDIDALVMHLLDLYGVDDSDSLATYSNQTVSERIKTPVSKVKKIRYDAALKFGGRIEHQAMGRLLAALSKASLEPDGEKVLLIIEDSLAKNWLQGQLKIHQIIFDHSFNTEIVKVSVAGLFQVLDSVFDTHQVKTFKEDYDAAKKKNTSAERVEYFKCAVKKFAEAAAAAAGPDVVTLLKTLV